MAKEHKSKWNLEDLTDTEIYDAIRYLEADSKSRNAGDCTATFVICVSVVILVLGCLALMWLDLK